MVLGVPGIQSQANAHFDGRLEVGAVFARLHVERKPAETQVVKKISYIGSGRTHSAIPLRQTASLVVA